MNLLIERKQKSDEGFDTLEMDIRKLTRKAYPTLNQQSLEPICVNHFVNAITDSYIKRRLREDLPTTLDRALTIARQLQAAECLDVKPVAAPRKSRRSKVPDSKDSDLSSQNTGALNSKSKSKTAGSSEPSDQDWQALI